MNERPFWIRYGVALFGVAAAILLRAGFYPVFGADVPFLFFYPAIFLAAVYGGIGPGLLSVGLSVVSASFWISDSSGRQVASSAHITEMATFVIVNLLMVWTCERMRRATRRAAKAEALRESAEMLAGQARDLRASQEQLRLLVEQAPVTVAMFDRNMNYIATSRRWLALYGRGHTDLTGLNHYEVKFDMPDHWREVHRQALAGAPQECEEDKWVMADGTVNWLRWAVHPWRDIHQGIGGIIISVEDITARKQAEEGLRQSEALLRAVCETTPDPIFAKDRESRMLLANPATLHAYGKSRGDVLGKRDDELCSDPGLARIILENDKRVIESGTAEEVEEHLETPYGRRVFLCNKAPYRDADGSIIGTIGVARDITERKRAEDAIRESEQRYRELFEQAPDAIVVLDLDLDRWVSANKSAERLFGCSRKELLAGGPLRFYPPNQPDGLSPEESRREHDLQALAGERVVCQRAVHNALGKDLICEVRVVRQTSTKRNLLRASYIDITERMRAEEALKRANEVALAANAAKDRFLAILSHELRTPLTPALMIIGSHEADEALSLELRADLAMVRRNLELEARLIDDLLDLNRVARGKIPLHLQPTDLHQTLGNVVAICREEIDMKGLALDLQLVSSNHNVNGDGGRLQQVFWNLLKNAAKFTPPGGSITVRSVNPRPGTVRVEVADTGLGINPEIIPQLFVPFQQGEARITQQFGGLGLGLAICKAVIDLHGGSIRVESEGEGKGATIAVELPTTSVRVPAENGAEAPPTARNPVIGNRNLKILLVEDNADTLRILRRLLEKAGCRVITAQSVSSALGAAETARREAEKFDLVVSDLGLPDGSGRDLMRQLHRVDRLVGIAISGYGMEDDIEKSRNAGFAEHLTKPVRFEELEAAISNLARSA